MWDYFFAVVVFRKNWGRFFDGSLGIDIKAGSRRASEAGSTLYRVVWWIKGWNDLQVSLFYSVFFFLVSDCLGIVWLLTAVISFFDFSFSFILCPNQMFRGGNFIFSKRLLKIRNLYYQFVKFKSLPVQHYDPVQQKPPIWRSVYAHLNFARIWIPWGL